MKSVGGTGGQKARPESKAGKPAAKAPVPPPKEDRELPLPPFITVNSLAKAMGIKMSKCDGISNLRF